MRGRHGSGGGVDIVVVIVAAATTADRQRGHVRRVDSRIQRDTGRRV